MGLPLYVVGIRTNNQPYLPRYLPTSTSTQQVCMTAKSPSSSVSLKESRKYVGPPPQRAKSGVSSAAVQVHHHAYLPTTNLSSWKRAAPAVRNRPAARSPFRQPHSRPRPTRRRFLRSCAAVCGCPLRALICLVRERERERVRGRGRESKTPPEAGAACMNAAAAGLPASGGGMSFSSGGLPLFLFLSLSLSRTFEGFYSRGFAVLYIHSTWYARYLCGDTLY
ncbi:uncharacterized protein K452DRAFT_44817 [Aplosporella prunicola CBS 121167]|uniref:Uncharacterized protein n=1 Tax=Aplosporella prunicola CBS 121167 TaxID=1176127 RepID=A0A6A6BAL5_9PEZI|nr:uncharacterized protein K452DRAFT_44817 [Aplosporella prunicola CBS 121167]KAF2141066.1 hypothetical protein K452DRAFT_44817 [Aplosporella prunicola CBS 121167]